MPRRRYSREFKIEAVKQVTDGGRGQAEVARELGIHQETLYRWKKELQADPAESFRGNGNRKARDREVDRLRRENERLRVENRFLKKVSAYFAKDQK